MVAYDLDNGKICAATNHKIQIGKAHRDDQTQDAKGCQFLRSLEKL